MELIIKLTLGICVIFNASKCRAEEKNCLSGLSDIADMQKIDLKCVQKLGLNISDLPQTYEAVEKIKESFNDKCISKCYMEEMNQLNANGQLDIPKITEYLQMNSSPEFSDNIQKIVNSCAQKFVNGNDICEECLKFFLCFDDKENKIC